MRLYFIRHGESEANVLHEFSNGLNKHPLTALGREQAQAMAAKMQEIPLTHIYSSPILRALQTAEMLAEPYGLKVEITAALREYDVGSFEGRTDNESWNIFDKINQDWLQGIDQDVRFPGGESFIDIKRRFLPFILSLQNKSNSHPEAHIALVGHGGTYRLMLPEILTNLSPQDISQRKMGNTVIITAVWEANGFRCLQWGDEIIS